MYFLDAIDFGGSLAKGFWDLIFWPRIFDVSGGYVI